QQEIQQQIEQSRVQPERQAAEDQRRQAEAIETQTRLYERLQQEAYAARDDREMQDVLRLSRQLSTSERDTLTAMFPSLSLEVIESVHEQCGLDINATTEALLEVAGVFD
ncbi:hypothetical protein SARC_18183, partial [Sphaeroforma arctica JP610]